MAKAYKRKDSPFVWISFSYNKKRYRKKTKYLVEDIAKVQKEVIPLMIAKIKSGDIVLEKENKKSFEYYSKLMLKSKMSLKQNSYYTLKNKIAIWNDFFKDRDIDTIKASEIKNFLFDKDIKVVSMKAYLNAIKQVFDEAILDDVFTVNPVAKIKLPKEQQTEIHPFSREEVKKLLEGANGYFKNMLAVAFYTGIRTGEMLALKWQNIDYSKKRICIDSTVGNYKEGSTKTNKIRFVPIFDNLVSYLKNQELKTGLQTYVFSSHLGTTLRPSNLYKYEWLPLLKRLKLPRRRLYDTRHSFVTNMLDSKKFSLNQIASWLGHNSVQTLIRHYNKFIDSEVSKFDSDFDVFNEEVKIETEYKKQKKEII